MGKYMDENNWKPEKGNLLPHFFPLTTWVIDSNGSFGVDTILCQEQWNEGIERLLNKLNRTTTSDSDSSLYKHRLQNVVMELVLIYNPKPISCSNGIMQWIIVCLDMNPYQQVITVALMVNVLAHNIIK